MARHFFRLSTLHTLQGGQNAAMVYEGWSCGVRAMQVVRTDIREVYPMKTLKRWVRGWLDWLAAKLGYTRADDAKAAWEHADAWRTSYTDAQRRYSFAQDRLNKLMRYKHVQAVAAMIDAGRTRK